MGVLRKYCGCCTAVLALVIAIIGVLTLKPVNDAVVIYGQENMEIGYPLSAVQMLQMFAGLAKCAYKGYLPSRPFSETILVSCTRTGLADWWFVPAHGWGGAGVGLQSVGLGGDLLAPGVFSFSHEAVRGFVNQAQLTRDPGMFIASKVKDWEAKELVPRGFFPLVIQLNTEDPERIKRRTLINDFFGALLKPPQLDLDEVAAAAGAASADFYNDTAVVYMVASCTFKSLYGIQLSPDVLASVLGWVKGAKPCAVGKCKPGAGRSTQDYFDKVFGAVAASEAGGAYLKAAADRGFQEPEQRLREMLFITMFAGIGGTSDTVVSTIHVLDKDKHLAELFWKGPRSFVIESARLYPAVAGMALLANEDRTLTFGNGRKHELKKGDFVQNWNAAANVDPTVFGGPGKSEAYARKFDPSRENLERMMTWNGELGEILACKTTVGCPGAARPCPGTRLALHTATEVTKFFAKGMGTKPGQKGQGEL